MSTITAPPLVTPTRTLPLGESAKSPVPVMPVGRGISGPVRNRLMFSSTIEFTPRQKPVRPEASSTALTQETLIVPSRVPVPAAITDFPSTSIVEPSPFRALDDARRREVRDRRGHRHPSRHDQRLLRQRRAGRLGPDRLLPRR